MTENSAQDLLKSETRVQYGPVPHKLGAKTLLADSWQLVGEAFLLRHGASHWFHYRKGSGITIERGEGADTSVEALWLSGSVYSAVASINGFMPIHASAVCHEGRVFAFTGPSGAGKSTLVTALAGRCLPLFCDDTLILDLSDPDRLQCLPGHKRLKLTEEALALTGTRREEKVGIDIEKYYAQPPDRHSGGPLPLGKLIFLEEGAECALEEISGAQRMVRLEDDHYTASHFAAARQFDPASRFAHLSRLANQMAMSRFTRPIDTLRFADSVSLACDYITGHQHPDREEG